ncbi:MAG: hypothetical protein H6810_10995 [Phycisphaeraceae bacterium]|nr:MAG: hypothetical protein H6810_10995 [Phycisphaeraceae bacterium]
MSERSVKAGLLAAMLIGATAAADTTVLIQDGFGDGDRDNDLILDGAATNPSDVGVPWYLARGATDVVVSVANDTGGINQGSALDVTEMTSFTRAFAAKFDPVTLNDGDRVRMRVVVRATENPVDPTDGGAFPTADSDRRFRFGFYSSNGTPLLDMDNDDSTVSDDDTGYLALIDIGTGEGNTYAIYGDKADGILGGSSVSFGATSANTSYYLGNTARMLELLLSRSGDNINVAITFDGELAQQGVADAVEDIQAFNLPYTFDYVAFGTSGASLDYRIDSILVDYTTADETIPQTDGFEDGDRDNDGIPEGAVNDAGDTGFTWYKSTGTSSFDVQVIDDSAGIGTGNVINPFSLTTSTRAMSAAIEPVELMADGDYIRFSFDVRLRGIIPDSDRRFRFGIENNGGTPVTTDGATEAVDDLGYMVQMDTGVSSSSTATVRGDLPNGLLAGSTRSLGGTTEDPAFSLDDNDTHRVEIEVRRRTDTDLGMDVNDVTFRMDGVEATSGTDDGAGDPAPLAYVFNQISFGTNSVSFVDYVIDNIAVETNVGTEPAFATNDGFEDGDRENDGTLEGAVNDAADVGFAWYMSTGTSSFEVTLVDDTAGIGTGNALNEFSLTTSTRAISAAIEPVTLATPGDSVTFEFDVRLNGAIPDSDRRFRFGIHSDGGTAVSADGSSQTGDDPGYMVQTDTGVSSSSTATVRGDLPNGLLSGSTRSLGGTTEDPMFSLDDNDAHHVAIRVERAHDGGLGRDVNLVTFLFDGLEATQGVDSGDGAGDDNPLTYDFNQISIGTSGAAFIDLLVDNIAVSTNTANPCPADLAPPYGVLDLSDITTFVSAFLNQTPQADFAPPYGVYDLADITGFIAAFQAGCP